MALNLTKVKPESPKSFSKEPLMNDTSPHLAGQKRTNQTLKGSEPTGSWWQHALSFVQGRYGEKKTPGGLPYREHAREVGRRIWYLTGEKQATLAAVLHGVLGHEHRVSTQELQASFGDVVFLLIESVTQVTTPLDTIKKSLSVAQTDIRPLMIQCASVECLLSWISSVPEGRREEVPIEPLLVCRYLMHHLSYAMPGPTEPRTIELWQLLTKLDKDHPQEIIPIILSEALEDMGESVLGEALSEHPQNWGLKISDPHFFRQCLESKRYMDTFSLQKLWHSPHAVESLWVMRGGAEALRGEQRRPALSESGRGPYSGGMGRHHVPRDDESE